MAKQNAEALAKEQQIQLEKKQRARDNFENAQKLARAMDQQAEVDKYKGDNYWEVDESEEDEDDGEEDDDYGDDDYTDDDEAEGERERGLDYVLHARGARATNGPVVVRHPVLC